MSDHASHILDHIKQVSETHGPKFIERLEQANGFKFNGAAVTHADGSKFTAKHCRNYLISVREILGEASFSFAKVKFLLAGCLGADVGD